MIQPKESKSNSHFYISVVKSIFRFAACVALWDYSLGSAAIFFGVAEVLGIAEEIF
jgi:hypothetical protein